MAEKQAAFTLALVRRATPTAVKWAAQRLRYRRRTGSFYPSRSVEGDTNRGEMVQHNAYTTGEERAVFTLAVVLKEVPKTVNWAEKRL